MAALRVVFCFFFGSLVRVTPHVLLCSEVVVMYVFFCTNQQCNGELRCASQVASRHFAYEVTVSRPSGSNPGVKNDLSPFTVAIMFRV